MANLLVIGAGVAGQAAGKGLAKDAQICEKPGIDSKLLGMAITRSAEDVWNPLHGPRGAPDGGACLPKDTLGFLTFCPDRGWQHLILEATIQVNHQLQEAISVAVSSEELD